MLSFLSLLVVAITVSNSASAALASSQGQNFYNTDGELVGTGNAYTLSSQIKPTAPQPAAKSDLSKASFSTLASSSVAADIAISGSLAGQPNVSATGTASYSIPIELPASRGGFMPSLSINYNSQQQDGILGHGWGISGLQSITRCPQNKAQDDQVVAVSFTNTDRFCLNGQRLILVSTDKAYGADGAEYRTEVDGFSKITSHGTAGTGPQNFIVRAKDGTELTFGTVANSRLMATQTSSTGVVNAQATVQQWGLYQVKAKNLNYWQVTYDNSVGTGQLYPIRIEYTGRSTLIPNNKIEFVYNDRDATSLSQLAFIKGSQFKLDKQLVKISIYSGLSTAREYRLAYQIDETVGGVTHPYKTLRLDSITRCDYQSEQPYCLTPTEIGWSSGAVQNIFSNPNDHGLTSRPGEVDHLIDDYQPLVGDMNGDGRADVLFVGSHPDVSYLALQQMRAYDGAGGSSYIDFRAPLRAGVSFQYRPTHYTLADVNSDGLADLVTASIGTTGFKFETYLSNGNYGFTKNSTINVSDEDLGSAPFNFQLKDLNGDGLLDPVATTASTTNAKVYSALKQSDGSYGLLQTSNLVTTVSGWSQAAVLDQSISDIDGDSRPDYIIAVRLNNNNYATHIAKGSGNGLFATPTSGVALSATNIANATASTIRSKSAYSPAAYQARLVDMNRDGLVDLVLDVVLKEFLCTGNNCSVDPIFDDCKADGCASFFQGIHVALSRGDLSYQQAGGFFETTNAIASNTINKWLPTYGDIEGNGTIDVVRISLDINNQHWLLFSNGVGNGNFYLPMGRSLSKSIRGNGLPAVATVAFQNDINSDGVAEVILPILYRDYTATSKTKIFSAYTAGFIESDSFSNVKLKNLVTQITEGSGVSHHFSYKPLMQDSSMYQKANNATYPIVDLNSPLYLVSTFESKLNNVSQGTTAYYYEHGKLDLSGRGFLGFAKTRQTSTRTGTKPDGTTETLTTAVETTYRQDFPYIGMPLTSTTRVNGKLVSETSTASTDFVSDSAYGTRKVYFPRTTKTTQKNYNFNATSDTLVSRQETTQTHENRFGNLTAQTQVAYVGTSTTAFGQTTATPTYFPADIANWKPGLLQRQVVATTRAGEANHTATTTYTYDTAWQVNGKVTEPDAPELRVQEDYVRDDFGNITQVTVSGSGDPAYPDTAITTRTQSFGYAAAADGSHPAGVYKTSETNAKGHTSTYTYDVLTGQTLTVTDPNGLITTMTYDALGRVLTAKTPDNVTTTLTHTTCATFAAVGTGTTGCEVGEKYLQTETRTGQATSYSFIDGLGRTVRTAQRAYNNTNWIITRTEYDNAGRVKRSSKPAYNSVTYANQQWTTIGYDVLGRQTRLALPGNRVTNTVYDGLVMTTTNPKSQNRTETRNIAGEVIEIKDHDSKKVTYRYNAVGQLYQTTDDANNSIVLTLDRRGLKRTQVDPDMGTWSYRYNALGQLVWQKNAKNQETTFSYDDLGRMTNRTEPDLVSTWEWDTVANRLGKLIWERSSNGFARGYYYDSAGRNNRIRTNKTADPQAQTAADPDFYTNFTFDSAGRVLTYTYPTGLGYRNIYDTNGYLKETRSLDQAELYWRADSRDALGNVIQETLGNGLTTKRTYKTDTDYLETLNTGPLSGTTLSPTVQQNSYGFDSLGNLSNRTLGQIGVAGQSVVETFVYDNINRLTEVRKSGVITGTATYDALGNIKTRNDVGVYNYTPATTNTARCGVHKVCGITPNAGSTGNLTTNFTYDENGNTLIGNGRTYTWTSFDQPLTITQGSGSSQVTESFAYDANHERLRRSSVENGQTTTTVYIGNPRIDLGGTFDKTYLPNNTIEYTHHLYAGGKAIGSIVTNTNVTTASTLWSTDLATAPTTVNPNPIGLTLPSNDTNQLISWDANAGNGRLKFTNKTLATALTMQLFGQRNYSNEQVVFSAEVTTSANSTGNGRYLLIGAVNTGSATGNFHRHHSLYLRGTTAYSLYADGKSVKADGSTQSMSKDLLYPIADNTTYVVEIETTSTQSILYLYRKGQTRQNGVRHALAIDWKGSATGTHTRRLRSYVYGAATETPSATYLDNISEKTFTGQQRRYFHNDHLGSLEAVTDLAGNVLERMSYDAWGKRRNVDGTASTTNIKGQTSDRGYTLHEMLDSVSLVHMNGRVYDPIVGRFISADPNIDGVDNLQGYNRYSYVKNNPLSATDPSGFTGQFNFDIGLNNLSGYNFQPISFDNLPVNQPNFQPNLNTLTFTPPAITPTFNFSAVFSGGSSGGSVKPIGPNTSFIGASSAPNIPSTGMHSVGDAELALMDGQRGSKGNSGCQRGTSCYNQIYNGLASFNSVMTFGLSEHIVGGPTDWESTGSYVGQVAGMAAGLFTGSAYSNGVRAATPSVNLMQVLPVETASSPNGKIYSVAFETMLNPTSYPGVTRYMHFKEANIALDAAMQADTNFATLMQGLGVGIPRSATGTIIGKSPPGWVWHHDVNPGVMQLVPKSQHPNIPGGIFWDSMHPGGVGGFSIWGK